MERDFLGLSSKEPLAVVKEEINNDACQDSGAQWQFLNKVSAISHLMSFKVSQEDKNQKIASDSHMSSGFMSISTADAFDASQKRSMAEIQNLAGVNVKQQLLGGIPATAPHSVIPTAANITGITEPWNGVKASGSPAQLTIFYGGTVHVYDDITPEKAQAIMLLAGNGSIASNAAHPKAQVQAPSSKLAAADGVTVNQPINTHPCSGLSSPLSVSSHTGAQSGSGSTGNDESMAAKTTGAPTTPVSKAVPLQITKMVVPFSSVAPVPQARKASLARFLEKRKERVMNLGPYNLNKKSPECTAQESNGANFCASPAAGAGSLLESKEGSHDV
ncbi:protein TIFY 6B-like isoform X4 [Quercus lobata]|uniref:protein TIFY 6B-like isoform X4 n=1 Tax=Quercus lobata TaxID=97700 RepID=UPI00124583EC|nr:protein TIFY 6B-like isoform X4 [Quercus lobata]